MQVKQEYDLFPSNTFRLRAKCERYIEYESVEELKSLDFASLPRPLLCIGEGSNLLFTKEYFPGTVLRSRINYLKYFDLGAQTLPVAVGSGVKWDDLVRKTCEDGLWGLENLSGIPGTVGGAAVQNIGAYGVEAKDAIGGLTCYDTQSGKTVSFKTPECRYGYRDSIFKTPEFKGRYIITGVLFRLERKANPKLGYKGLETLAPKNPMDVRQAVLALRDSKLPDPGKIGSAGSFFRNPVLTPSEFLEVSKDYDTVPHYVLEGGMIKVPAAWMIEQCGLKGERVGGAEVYSKQPLVLVNASGQALSSDVLGLEAKIVETVKKRFGVELIPEVEHV